MQNIIHLEWDLAEAALATDAGREMAKDSLKNDLPLHLACERRAPPSTIAALLDAHPRAASVQGRRGALPLHLASERNSPPAVIVSLIRSFPEALDREDGSNRLPRDYPQRNDICREALNRPSACWIEDVEKEDYLRRVARKRTLLRQKMVQLRCAVAISAERRDRTKRAIEELEPALQSNEEHGKRHEAEEVRMREVEERARGRIRELSKRVDTISATFSKAPAEKELSAQSVQKCSYMTESQFECEKLVEKMAKIKSDMRELKEILSTQTQYCEPGNTKASEVFTKDYEGPAKPSDASTDIWKIDV